MAEGPKTSLVGAPAATESNHSVITQHLHEVSENRLRRTLFVGGLDEDLVTKPLLMQVFQTFGDIRTCEIPINRATNKHRGFGFIEYEEDADAKDAIENMNGGELCGRVLTVNLARHSNKEAQLPDHPDWAYELMEKHGIV